MSSGPTSKWRMLSLLDRQTESLSNPDGYLESHAERRPPVQGCKDDKSKQLLEQEPLVA